VFYRWLHFLGGESFVLGYLTEKSENMKEELLEILQYAFSQETSRAMQRFPLVTCVPSFLTLPDETIQEQSSHHLKSVAIGKTLQFVLGFRCYEYQHKKVLVRLD